MKRRDFIKKTGFATAGAFAVPYLLPTGRLFAATGSQTIQHVVFCLFAGGVRNLDSVQKADGNLMPNMLTGTESISADILPYLSPLPSPFSTKLQSQGTLFKQFRYSQGPTGHFNGHTCAITGAYTNTDLNIKDHPKTPTIFELYRKHTSPSRSALKSWWVSNTLGPYPALNFSAAPGYGANYGANFIAPTYLVSTKGYGALGNLKNFNSAEEAAVNNIRNFVNHNFKKNYIDGDAGVTNPNSLPDKDADNLRNWITDLLNKGISGQFANPWGAGSSMNNDMYNIFFAEEIIKQYHPELLVVNMQDVDVCHFDFMAYCNNLRKADYAVAHLWDTIQKDSIMKDKTVMIVVPEHGRNKDGNSNVVGGRRAIDHSANIDGTSGDQMAREIFCLVLGPPAVVKRQEINTVKGESIEVASAIAHLLGFDSQMPGGILAPFAGSGIEAAFV